MDDRTRIAGGAVVLVNVFTPKTGRTDDFIRAQTAEYVRLAGQVEGALGNRLLRALDGAQVVNIAYFASVELYEAWRGSELFADHIDYTERHAAKRPWLVQLLARRKPKVAAVAHANKNARMI